MSRPLFASIPIYHEAAQAESEGGFCVWVLRICTAFTTFMMMLVNHTATGFTGETRLLRLQKCAHILLCVHAVLYQINIIVLLIPLIKAFNSGAWKTATFKAPLKALFKSAFLFYTIPTAIPSDFIYRGAATITRLLTA
jgi:uncharacterized membrane protein